MQRIELEDRLRRIEAARTEKEVIFSGVSRWIVLAGGAFMLLTGILINNIPFTLQLLTGSVPAFAGLIGRFHLWCSYMLIFGGVAAWGVVLIPGHKKRILGGLIAAGIMYLVFLCSQSSAYNLLMTFGGAASSGISLPVFMLGICVLAAAYGFSAASYRFPSLSLYAVLARTSSLASILIIISLFVFFNSTKEWVFWTYHLPEPFLVLSGMLAFYVLVVISGFVTNRRIRKPLYFLGAIIAAGCFTVLVLSSLYRYSMVSGFSLGGAPPDAATAAKYIMFSFYIYLSIIPLIFICTGNFIKWLAFEAWQKRLGIEKSRIEHLLADLQIEGSE